MQELLNRCKHLGIKFDTRIERLAELQELLFEAVQVRSNLEDNFQSTTAISDIIYELREAIARTEKKKP